MLQFVAVLLAGGLRRVREEVQAARLDRTDRVVPVRHEWWPPAGWLLLAEIFEVRVEIHDGDASDRSRDLLGDGGVLQEARHVDAGGEGRHIIGGGVMKATLAAAGLRVSSTALMLARYASGSTRSVVSQSCSPALYVMTENVLGFRIPGVLPIHLVIFAAPPFELAICPQVDE